MVFGYWGWLGPTWEHVLSESWYLTYPPLTTILAVNDPMLLISGKMALTQQSTGIGDWFLAVEDGDRPMWQHTTSDLVVILYHKISCYGWRLAAGRVKEQTTIYRKNTYHGYDI